MNTNQNLVITSNWIARDRDGNAAHDQPGFRFAYVVQCEAMEDGSTSYYQHVGPAFLAGNEDLALAQINA